MCALYKKLCSSKIHALLLLLVPSLGRADMGSAGGFALLFGIGIAIWMACVLLIFFALRKKFSTGKRIAIASSLFLLPFVKGPFDAIRESLYGTTPQRVTEITRAPMTVYGVPFPKGSRVVYQDSGGSFGKMAIRALHEIHSPSPVLLGNVHISAFIYIPNNEHNFVRVILSENETVDGVACRDTTLHLDGKTPRLHSCFLATPHLIAGRAYAAGVFVFTKLDDSTHELVVQVAP